LNSEKLWRLLKESKLSSEKIRKIQKNIVKWYGKYGRKVSWNVKWCGKYGRKENRILIRYENMEER
jgi:hypothetical protein